MGPSEATIASDEPGSWTPRPERRHEILVPEPAAALHGLLDAPGPPPGSGQALPPLWHWLHFLPVESQRDLGPDGHPKRGGFLPPTRLPRRMFVGGRLRMPRSLTIGAEAVREGVVHSTDEKSGRSGELLFVRVGYRLGDNDGGMLDDDQDLVYREAAQADGTAFRPAPERPVDLDDQAWTLGLDLTVDPVLLFRFSALTYNAHRIHYDRAWATGVEGYPGLVVHGPLQAIALAELCRRFLPERRVTGFTFRALTPAFDEGPLRLRGRVGSDADGVDLVAFDVHGEATLQAEARLGA